MNDMPRPHYPWSQGDELFAEELNAAIANSGAYGPFVPVHANSPANVMDFGADPTGATDSAPAINAALATGRPTWLPRGTYKVCAALNVPSGGVLRGEGRGVTNLTVDQSFSATDSGVIVLTGREELAPIVSDLRIAFQQPPDQIDRANFRTLAQGGTSYPGGTGIKYPPAILGNGSNRWKVERIQISGAWDGITVDATGQPGFITEIEVGALNCGLFVGQARDVFHVSHYHFWSFGFTAGNQPILNGVYFDGNTVAIDIGSQGGVNGANMTDIFAQAKINISGGVSTWAHFTNLMMDGPNSLLNMTDGQWVQISNMYSVGAPARGASVGLARINQAGGQLFINNLFTSAYGAPSIAISGGVIRLLGAQLLNGTYNVPSITCSGGGDLDVQDVLFGTGTTSGAWTVPVVSFTSSGACRFSNNIFREASPGDVGGLVITTDAAKHSVDGNAWNGWKFSIPGISGQYGFSHSLVAQKQMYLNALPAHAIAYNIDANAGQQRAFNVTTDGLLRWALLVDAGAESGGNAGSGFSISRYNDAGTTPVAAFNATRQGVNTLNGVLGVNGNTTVTGQLTVTGVVTLQGNVGIGGFATSSQWNVGTAAGPNIRSGTGAATGTQPAGSLWLRTDGTTANRLYVSAGGGTWAAVAGV